MCVLSNFLLSNQNKTAKGVLEYTCFDEAEHMCSLIQHRVCVCVCDAVVRKRRENANKCFSKGKLDSLDRKFNSVFKQKYLLKSNIKGMLLTLVRS